MLNPTDYYARIQPTATHAGKHLTIENVLHILSGFDLYHDRLIVKFPDWTIDSFKNRGATLDLFAKTYQLAGDEFADFYTANQSVFDAVKEKARLLCNAPGAATFNYFRLSVEDRKLSINFHLDGEDFPKNFYGATYNQLIIDDVASSTTENPSLVELAVTKAFEIAFTLDPAYWQTTTLYFE